MKWMLQDRMRTAEPLGSRCLKACFLHENIGAPMMFGSYSGLSEGLWDLCVCVPLPSFGLQKRLCLPLQQSGLHPRPGPSRRPLAKPLRVSQMSAMLGVCWRQCLPPLCCLSHPPALHRQDVFKSPTSSKTSSSLGRAHRRKVLKIWQLGMKSW